MEKKKKYLILGIIILLVLGGVTVAYLTWSSDKINIGLNSDCFTIDYTKGGDINNAKLKPLSNNTMFTGDGTFTIREGMALTYANIGIKSSCNIEGYGSLYLNITSLSDAFTATGESYQALGYAVLRNTSSVTDITIDNLKDQEFEMVGYSNPITSTGKIKLLTEQLFNTEVNKYIIVIFISNEYAGNDVIGASFSGKISAEANQGIALVSNSCFTTSSNDTDKTVAITDYTCYSGNDNGNPVVTNVNIPNELPVKYTAVTNPSSTVSTACENYLVNTLGATADQLGDICKGGNDVNGNNLQTLLDNSGMPDYMIEKLIEIGSVTADNYTVTSIGDNSFKNKDLDTVVIPNTVTSIGNNAFSGNNLTKVTIPSSVTTLGSFAFLNNKLTNITIGKGITSVGDGVFGYYADTIKVSNSSKFEDIKYFIDTSKSTQSYCFDISDKDETNKTATISKYNCYEGNSNGYETITDVVIPSKIDGYKITKIGTLAFCTTINSTMGGDMCATGAGLTSVIIPDTIVTIGDKAFVENNLQTLLLSSSVTSIGSFAFAGNQLTELTIPDTVTSIDSYAFQRNKIKTLKLSNNITKISYSSFSSNQLTSLTIPNSVTSIDNYAFENNNITNITIPDFVTSIGMCAFRYNNLRYVLIGSSSNLNANGISAEAFSSSNETSGNYVDNPNLKIIYNNSGKSFKWDIVVCDNYTSSGTSLVTGTIQCPSGKSVTVTTGQP